NTVLSAVYYIKVLRVMILDSPPEEADGRPVTPLPLPAGSALYGTVLAVMIFVVFLAWEPLGRASDQGVDRFQNVPPTVHKARVKRRPRLAPRPSSRPSSAARAARSTSTSATPSPGRRGKARRWRRSSDR